ncbi:hypothetical protein V6N13_111337 [Hibiscus sabdariffa]|uniref:Uncharacterized protein n=1 Tax=Hibiscus sabdariffa TaxID=183260 RepID=A0ABR2TKD3_9ROSI
MRDDKDLLADPQQQSSPWRRSYLPTRCSSRRMTQKCKEKSLHRAVKGILKESQRWDKKEKIIRGQKKRQNEQERSTDADDVRTMEEEEEAYQTFLFQLGIKI